MNSKISQAVAAALALGATAGAYAVDLSTLATSPNNILFISGSTAIDNGIKQRFLNTTDGLCGSSIDIYQSASSGAPTTFNAIACNSGANATKFGIALNTPIAFIKEDNAGSANGIVPVNNNTAIAFPTVSLLNTANCGSTSPHSCNTSVTATNHVSNFGFSDVNAELFGANTSNLNLSASLDTLFGAAVSLGFYHALQNLQLGLTGTNADDSVNNMPTLTRGQIYTILQGLLPPSVIVNTANTKDASTTTQLFGTNTVASSFCGSASTPCATSDANNIYLCLRGQTSGTMQASQVYFGNIGCAAGAPGFAQPTHTACATDGCGWTTSTYASDTVFAGNGTGDVLTCLQNHDSQGHFALGIVGIENGWGSYTTNTARKDWRFVKINGVVPSYENVAADRYQYWAQSASYSPKAGRGNVPTGVAANLATAASQVGSVGTVAALNSSFNYTAPAFDGGFLAIPGVGSNTPNPSNASVATFRSNPVNSYNRGAPTASNNCQIPSLDLTAPDSSDYPTWAVP